MGTQGINAGVSVLGGVGQRHRKLGEAVRVHGLAAAEEILPGLKVLAPLVDLLPRHQMVVDEPKHIQSSRLGRSPSGTSASPTVGKPAGKFPAAVILVGDKVRHAIVAELLSEQKTSPSSSLGNGVGTVLDSDPRRDSGLFGLPTSPATQTSGSSVRSVALARTLLSHRQSSLLSPFAIGPTRHPRSAPRPG